MVTFDEFTRDRLGPLLRFATVLCGERELAEDVVQEVFLRAHGRWDRIGGLAAPEAFVRRMIVNEFLSWRRKWARITPRAEIRPTATVPDPAGRHADRDLLAGELAKLPPRQRTVIVLRYYGGRTDAEIAEELGCRQATVRAHAARALATLRIDLRPRLALGTED